jgi:hypothetical protein
VTSEQNPAKALERLLRQSFRTGTDKTRAGSCLDAETLAAWADGTLARKDLAAAEAHVSSCDRCVALLAAMERAGPPAVVSKRWWSHSPTLRWLVPLTAAVTVVAVWVAVPREQQLTVTKQVDAGATSVTGLSADSSAVASRDAKAEAPRAKADAPAVTGALGATRAPESPRFEDRDRTAAADEQSARREKQSAPAREPEVRDLRKDGAANAAADRAPMDRVAGVAGGVAGAPPPPAAPAAAPLSETIQISGARLLARSAPIQIISPDPSVRWRVTGGFVERSSDGGATWTATSTQLMVNLTAGASPSPSVCWLVGSAGTVLLSTDGTQFRVVPFPERIDLATVRTTDGRNATVTASDGRTFATADGGLTWLAKP